jgi:LPXTG cell wall anchor motif
MRKLLAIAGLAIALAAGLAVGGVRPSLAGNPGHDKVTICHAAGREGTTHYVELTIGYNAVYGPGGHFNEDGTPQAGHERDYLGPCRVDSTSTETTTTGETTTTDHTTTDHTTTEETTTQPPETTTTTSTPPPTETTSEPGTTEETTTAPETTEPPPTTTVSENPPSVVAPKPPSSRPHPAKPKPHHHPNSGQGTLPYTGSPAVPIGLLLGGALSTAGILLRRRPQ